MTRQKNEYKKTVVIGDVHIPFQDKVSVSLVLSFLRFYHPEVVILNGDILDCFSISKFDRALNEGKSLKEEITEAKTFLSQLRAICPKARIVYVFGN